MDKLNIESRVNYRSKSMQKKKQMEEMIDNDN
jgi:hypothetical protein